MNLNGIFLTLKLKPREFRTSVFFIGGAVTFTLGQWSFQLTKTTAAPSQELVEGRSWYFLKRIRSWELNQTGFWIFFRRNLKNKHDLKRVGIKKGVRPCTCLCIDSIFTWIVTRPRGLPLPDPQFWKWVGR